MHCPQCQWPIFTTAITYYYLWWFLIHEWKTCALLKRNSGLQQKKEQIYVVCILRTWNDAKCIKEHETCKYRRNQGIWVNRISVIPMYETMDLTSQYWKYCSSSEVLYWIISRDTCVFQYSVTDLDFPELFLQQCPWYLPKGMCKYSF